MAEKCEGCGRYEWLEYHDYLCPWCGHDNKAIDCEECGGTGFSGQGTGYDSVCDNCGGKGEIPKQ